MVSRSLRSDLSDAENTYRGRRIPPCAPSPYSVCFPFKEKKSEYCTFSTKIDKVFEASEKFRPSTDHVGTWREGRVGQRMGEGRMSERGGTKRDGES